jgi:hypothetical protein
MPSECGQTFVTRHNLSGQLIQLIQLGHQPQGVGLASLDLRRLASGLYFAVLEEDSGAGAEKLATTKVAVVK